MLAGLFIPVVLAGAAPPDDTTVLRLTPEGLPAFTPCPAPIRTTTAPPTVEPPQPPTERFPSFPLVDLGSGAPPTPASTVARAPARLGDEPLRGAPADLAALRARVTHPTAGPLRVAVWGDSHTVGDLLVGQLRRTLQARYGDAGSGFLFPFAPFTPGPVAAVTPCARGSWSAAVTGRGRGGGGGLAGATATGADGAILRLVVDDEARPGAELRLDILHAGDTPAGALQLLVDGAAAPMALPAAKEGGVTRLVLPVGPHELELRVVAETVRLGGVIVERDPIRTPGAVVDGLGAALRPFSAWSSWDPAAMRRLLARRPYDIWVLSTGSADVNRATVDEGELRASFAAAFAAFRAIEPTAPCVVVGPGDRGVVVDADHVLLWTHQAMANRLLRELAPAAHCVTWDLQAAMGGEGSAVAWRDAGLMSADLLHFSPAGYALLGSRLTALIDPR